MDMQQLQAKMAKAKRSQGHVVFVKHRMMPVPQPMRGAALATREEAQQAAKDMLANPIFVQAWVVSADGIVEVS